MDYNTVRSKLIIPEYGRNIQKMVEFALQEKDRDKRTAIANLIVNVMFQLSPTSRETPEARHKIWDHLHIISDYRLDVDSPFPPPVREEQEKNINKLVYPHKQIKYPHYGNNIQLLIEKALTHEEGPQRDALVMSIANHMKKLYLTWNKESVEDDVISQNLTELSKGKIKLDGEIKLNNTREILQVNKSKKKKFTPRQGGSNNHNRNKFRRDFSKQ